MRKELSPFEELENRGVYVESYPSAWTIGIPQYAIAQPSDLDIVKQILGIEFDTEKEILRNMSRVVATSDMVGHISNQFPESIEAVISLEKSGDKELAGYSQVILGSVHKDILSDPETMKTQLEHAQQIFAEYKSTSELLSTDLPSGVTIVRVTGTDEELMIQFANFVTATYSDSRDEVIEGIKDKNCINLAAISENGRILGTIEAHEDSDYVKLREGQKKKKLRIFEVSELKVTQEAQFSEEQRQQIQDRLSYDLMRSLSERQNIHAVVHYLNVHNDSELITAARTGFQSANRIAKQCDIIDNKRVNMMIAYLPGETLRQNFKPVSSRRQLGKAG